MIGDRARTVIIGVVTFVWAVNFLAGLIPALGYKPDQAINAIFMAIVGGLLAIRKRPNEHPNTDDDEPPVKRVVKRTARKIAKKPAARPLSDREPDEEPDGEEE